MNNERSECESAAYINKRIDDNAMNDIIEALKSGGRLKLHRKINKAVIEGLPENHPCMTIKKNKLITISRARKLERIGLIVQSGIDQYMLNPELHQEEINNKLRQK